jgi:colanic acid biosynthesis protein WcaH
MMIPQQLYDQIIRVMPIPAVDLIVENEKGMILLARRANEPAKGQWWFPGGRVYFLETRIQAASRKLKEECHLEAEQISELGTYDVIVERSDNSTVRVHGITTLFRVRVGEQINYVLDAQNSEADWRLPQEWLQLDLHPFVQKSLLNYKD